MPHRTVIDQVWGDPSLRAEIARAEVKASVIDTRRRVVEERYGKRGVEAVASALGPELGPMFITPPFISTWHSLDKLAHVDAAIISTHLGGDASRFSLIADEAAMFELNAVYTFLLKLGSPEWVLKRIGSVFSAKARPGVMREVETGPKKVWLEMTGMVMPYYYLAFVLPTWAQRAVKLTGGRDPQVEMLECPHWGDRRTFWRVDWR